MSEGNAREFEIGLALAGAASAGAYTAGVMDFLFEALQEWEAAKERNDPNLPPWSVRIRCMAGTSAGGLTAVIGAGSLTAPHNPVRQSYAPGHHPLPEENRFFSGWISGFNYQRMFSCDDLDIEKALKAGEKPEVRSLLNCEFMSNHAKKTIAAVSTSAPIPTWAKDIELYITTTNLRGIPYSLDGFYGASGDSKFKMLQHGDYIAFTASSKPRDGFYNLDLNATRDDPIWEKLLLAAQATSAFPCAFPAVTISTPRHHYASRGRVPDWPEGMPAEIEYEALDGGAVRNEPFGMVRQAMHAAKGTSLSSDASKAWGAVILVDAFPDSADLVSAIYKTAKPGVVHTLMQLMSSLLGEARFMQEELDAVLDDGNKSLFQIAPSRDNVVPGARPVQLATGTLGAFGGLLHPRVRAHDFLLGRRNCQRFLTDVLTIPAKKCKENPIFGVEAAEFCNKDGNTAIIPLCGTALHECTAPVWPTFNARDRKSLEGDFLATVEKRIQSVLSVYAHNLGISKNRSWMNAPWNAIVRKMVSVVSDKCMDVVKPHVAEALDAFREGQGKKEE